MTDKIQWIRPSGNPLTSNNDPETIENLERLGYTQAKASKPKQAKTAKSSAKGKTDI